MLYDPLFDKLPVVIGPDHPLSLGYKVRLCLRDKRQRKGARADKKAYRAFKTAALGAAGMCVEWSQNRTVIIFVDCEEDGVVVPFSRLAGLVAHEASHAVDGFFRRTGVVNNDTEVRAYHVDWIVTAILRTYER